MLRVLGAERRPERVDLAERAGEDFAFELAADGQVTSACRRSRARSRSCAPSRRQLVEVERRDAEHRPGPFAVAGRDDRRVDVEEALLLEEVVDRLRLTQLRTRATAPKVFVRGRRWAIVAEQLERVPLLLQRIGFGIGRCRGRSTFAACTSVAWPLPPRGLHLAFDRRRCSRR